MTTPSKKLNVKTLGLGALAAIALSLTMPATSAMAADGATETATPVFQVKSASDGKIRAGATAFKRGDYKKALTFSNSALSAGLSPRKAAIAQSNLCATYAMIGDMDKANEACITALELRPNYAPAEANKAALTLKLAQLN